MTQLNPFVFAKGDETTAHIGLRVVENIFTNIPRINIPLNVEQRLDTNDECIQEFVQSLKKYGTGYKGSTTSKNPNIVNRSMGSANILLRPAAGVVGLFRMLKHPSLYNKKVAIFRYASGGFYNEIGCNIFTDQYGDEYMDTTSQMNLSDLEPFAKLAITLSKEYDLRLMVSSKTTISKSEKIFSERITNVFDSDNTKYGTELTDIALGRIASEFEGGWLWLFDNPNGDSASDIVELVDKSRSMGSTLLCRDGSSYEELPGGTAPDLLGSNYSGNDGTFFNPLSIILAIGSCIQTVNPQLTSWISKVNEESLQYFKDTTEANRNTLAMIDQIAQNVGDPA